MVRAERRYLPAAGVDWLLPFYDVLVRWSGMEALQRALVEQCRIEPGQKVLDVGCGTGSLVVLTKSLHPQADVTGIDPDPKALARARRKMQRAGVEVALDEGFAQELPYAHGTFDRVMSSFMFHHLKPEDKQGMLREVRRVLKAGGEFHLIDFAPDKHRRDGFFARLVHHDASVEDNAGGRIAEYLRQAGFAGVQETFERGSIFGRAACFRGRLS